LGKFPRNAKKRQIALAQGAIRESHEGIKLPDRGEGKELDPLGLRNVQCPAEGRLYIQGHPSNLPFQKATSIAMAEKAG